MKLTILSTLLLAALLFVGCQKEDAAPSGESNYPEDGVVRIATGVNGLQTRADSPYGGSTLSLTVDYGDGNKYTQTDVKWTNSGSAWSTDDVMVWKNPTTPTHIYAYAPYLGVQSDMKAVTFSAQADQSGGLTSSDLVGFVDATFTPSADLEGDAIPIAFNHKMSKLNIKLTFGGEFGEGDPVVSSVSVRAKTAVNYNATTAAATATGEVATITPYGSEATYSVIFSPQTIKGAKFISIAIGDDTYSYTVTAVGGHKFASNTNYTLTLRVGKDNDKIELVNYITVGEWGSGGITIGGDAVEKPVPSPSAYVIVGVTATDSIYVYDRNAGIHVPTPEDVPIAPNYTNNAPTVNKEFKGDYYTWAEAEIGKNSDDSPMCAAGWRWPTKDEMDAIAGKMERDHHGQDYAISYITNGVAGDTCYFPMCGSAERPNEIVGRYWSSNKKDYGSGGWWYLSVKVRSCYTITTNDEPYEYPVRCVKDVP